MEEDPEVRVKDMTDMETVGGLLMLARRYNGELGEIFSDPEKDEADVIHLLKIYGRRAGQMLMRRQWHKVDGSAAGFPFEMDMVGMMFLITAWNFDIFHRKSRDRRAPHMAIEATHFQELLNKLIFYIESKVYGAKGEYAFRLYLKDLVTYRQVERLMELGFLPGLSRWQRWWYRRFGIPEHLVYKGQSGKNSAD